MDIVEKKMRLNALWEKYTSLRDEAYKVRREHQSLEDEIAQSEAKFKVGSVICIFVSRWNHKTREHKRVGTLYRISRVTSSVTFAFRIKKDGSDGTKEVRLYSYDINKAELVEPPK